MHTHRGSPPGEPRSLLPTSQILLPTFHKDACTHVHTQILLLAKTPLPYSGSHHTPYHPIRRCIELISLHEPRAATRLSSPLYTGTYFFTLRLILLSVTYLQILLTTPPHTLSNPFRSLAHSILLTASLGTHAASRRHRDLSVCHTHIQLSLLPESVFYAKSGAHTQT